MSFNFDGILYTNPHAIKYMLYALTQNAHLGNSNSLLLHDLVHGHAIEIAHLVKLINAHNTPVRKHHRTGFKTTVACKCMVS